MSQKDKTPPICNTLMSLPALMLSKEHRNFISLETTFSTEEP